MKRANSWSLLIAPFLVLFLAVSPTTGTVWVQAQGDPPHPAHIHSGTCDNLGDIVAPLNDVQLRTAGESFGAASAIPVEESDTEATVSLGTILGAPHAINVHESAEAIQNYIACGDIGGRVVDGRLTIGLRELNGSGYSGVAVLEDRDAATNVVVLLAVEETAEGEAAPAADAAETPAVAAETPVPAETPEAEAPAAEEPAVVQEVPVDIRDFLFSPDPVQVPAGGTVTWTNQGNVPHTATATERDVLQSGAIAPGASFSQEFPTAGEFSYFCEFHPNMTGTIVVQ
jgi:plastocyanin